MATPSRASVEPISDAVRALVARVFGEGVEPRLELSRDPEAQPGEPALEVVVIPTVLPPAEANVRLDELLVAADGLNVVFDVVYP